MKDPTLRVKLRTSVRPCIVNVESHSSELKFFDLLQAKNYQILQEQWLLKKLKQTEKYSIKLLENKSI